MKTQISFIAPLISSIVVGLASMITSIMLSLGNRLGGSGLSIGGQASNLKNLFGGGMPTYFFQIVVGLYIVEVVFILSGVASNIENGADSLGERYFTGSSLIKSTLLYVLLSFVIILVFNLIAGAVVGGASGGALPSAASIT